MHGHGMQLKDWYNQHLDLQRARKMSRAELLSFQGRRQLKLTAERVRGWRQLTGPEGAIGQALPEGGVICVWVRHDVGALCTSSYSYCCMLLTQPISLC